MLLLNYYPFGMKMPGRYGNDGEKYRYGFNGMESDDEMFNQEGNSYDFGARMYDPRIIRMKSVDPKTSLVPSFSPYSFAANSPLMFIDEFGELPKVAIMLVPSKGENGHNDFNDHKSALEKQGYKVVYASTGKQALEMMQSLSSPESPIEELILLSHGSPGGLSNGTGGGIYTEAEIEGFAEGMFISENYDIIGNAVLQGKGIVTDVNSSEYNEDKYYDALETYDSDIRKSADDLFDKTKYIYKEKYKKESGAITIKDIAKKVIDKSVNIKNLKVVCGGCNLGGYVPLDNQDVFSTEMSNMINAIIYSAQGYTKPVENSTKRQSNTWIKTENGNRTDLKKSTIDLSNPNP